MRPLRAARACLLTVWGAAALPVGCSTAPRAPPPLSCDFEADFLRARRAILDGVDGTTEGGLGLSLPKAELEALHAERPEDARVVAYLGSLRLLEGKAEFLPWKKGALCTEGLRLLDRAVAAAPTDLELRFVRGRSTLPLPGFFRREAQAREDILYVAARAVAATAEGKLDPEVAAAALLEEGIIREEGAEREKARQSWRAAAEISPESRYGQAARARITGE